jgi:hypothetical protein
VGLPAAECGFSNEAFGDTIQDIRIAVNAVACSARAFIKPWKILLRQNNAVMPQEKLPKIAIHRSRSLQFTVQDSLDAHLVKRAIAECRRQHGRIEWAKVPFGQDVFLSICLCF